MLLLLQDFAWLVLCIPWEFRIKHMNLSKSHFFPYFCPELKKKKKIKWTYNSKICSHQDIKSSFVIIRALSNSNYFGTTVKICSSLLIHLRCVAFFLSDYPQMDVASLTHTCFQHSSVQGGAEPWTALPSSLPASHFAETSREHGHERGPQKQSQRK